MKVAQLEKIVVAALEDIKGKEIEVIDTSKLTPLFERIVIASGDSNRHVRSLARNVGDKVREAGGDILSTEGVRAYYALEDLWGGKGPERVRRTASAAA